MGTLGNQIRNTIAPNSARNLHRLFTFFCLLCLILLLCTVVHVCRSLGLLLVLQRARAGRRPPGRGSDLPVEAPGADVLFRALLCVARRPLGESSPRRSSCRTAAIRCPPASDVRKLRRRAACRRIASSAPTRPRRMSSSTASAHRPQTQWPP